MPAFKDGSVIAFINYGAGTCLDLTASDPKDGNPVIGYNYNATSNQHWKLVKASNAGTKIFPAYILVNQATGTALDLYNGGKDNGTPINGWAKSNTANPHQFWRIITADGNADVVAIQNLGTGTYVDLYNGGSQNSTKITGWAGNPLVEENTHQLWKVKIISA